MILGLHHIAIFVKDLEVSRKFYCEKQAYPKRVSLSSSNYIYCPAISRS